MIAKYIHLITSPKVYFSDPRLSHSSPPWSHLCEPLVHDPASELCGSVSRIQKSPKPYWGWQLVSAGGENGKKAPAAAWPCGVLFLHTGRTWKAIDFSGQWTDKSWRFRFRFRFRSCCTWPTDGNALRIKPEIAHHQSHYENVVARTLIQAVKRAGGFAACRRLHTLRNAHLPT